MGGVYIESVGARAHVRALLQQLGLLRPTRLASDVLYRRARGDADERIAVDSASAARERRDGVRRRSDCGPPHRQRHGDHEGA